MGAGRGQVGTRTPSARFSPAVCGQGAFTMESRGKNWGRQRSRETKTVTEREGGRETLRKRQKEKTRISLAKQCIQ